MARDGRGQFGSERKAGKGAVPVADTDLGLPEIEHTQPMERTVVMAGPDMDEPAYPGIGLPRIEQLPPGILVEEASMGRATGQWIVQIRCECGRRWFDVEMVKTARCPRCAAMVLIEPID